MLSTKDRLMKITLIIIIVFHFIVALNIRTWFFSLLSIFTKYFIRFYCDTFVSPKPTLTKSSKKKKSMHVTCVPKFSIRLIISISLSPPFPLLSLPLSCRLCAVYEVAFVSDDDYANYIDSIKIKMSRSGLDVLVSILIWAQAAFAYSFLDMHFLIW